MRNNLGDTEDKLEAQTIAQSEWERLSHMSLDELEANRNTFKTPYSAGTGSQYTISVNLGEKGTFNNGTCGAVSGGYANCFKNTTITVYRDGSRMFTTRTLPLMAGDYTKEEINSLLDSIRNDYTSKINNEATARANKDNDLQKQINNLSAKFGNYYTKPEIDKLFEEKGSTGLVYKDYLYLYNSGQGSNGMVTGSIYRETYIGSYLLSTQTVKSFGPYLGFTETYNGHTIKKEIDWAGSIYVDGIFIGGIYNSHTIKYLLDSKKI